VSTLVTGAVKRARYVVEAVERISPVSSLPLLAAFVAGACSRCSTRTAGVQDRIARTNLTRRPLTLLPPAC
jgi:hypothetical protein